MKQFIKHIAVFVACVLILCGLIGGFNWFQLQKSPKLGNTEILMAGDSRIMTALNPDLIPNSMNIAQNSESYIITFYKLKYLLEHNHQVKKIILGFSYPSFSAYLDGIFDGDIATADVFSRIYPIMKPRDFGNLNVDKVTYNRVWLQQMLVYPHINHHTYLGGFTRLSYGLDRANLQGVLMRHYYKPDSSDVGISSCAKIYLDSIVSLTQKRNIELVLVNVPFQQEYLKKVPAGFAQYYDQVKEEMISRKIRVFDYSHFPMEDKYFKDYNHLDLEGANYFTNLLKSDISKQ